MPKLNDLKLADRLHKRIAELEAGVEIAAKDVRALLTDAQHAELESAWQHQQQLRKGKRATTEAQQKSLGWKTKRELRVEAFKQALAELEGNELEALKKLQYQKQVRQSQIYLDTYFAELDSGANKHQADARANNALTRAHLSKYQSDVGDVDKKRSKHINDLEQKVRDTFVYKHAEAENSTKKN